jgi:hypothetical protein
MKKFIDRDKSGNLHDGVEYFAVGLVTEEYSDTPSGKEIAVTFIDPWGKVCLEWRARSEVVLSDISDGDANILLSAFERMEAQG